MPPHEVEIGSLSCTQLASPRTPSTSSGQEAPHLAAQDSTICSDPILLDSLRDDGKPIPTEGPVPTTSATPEGGGARGEQEVKKPGCGVCGDLLLAVVLTVFSPIIAVGLCMADILTGECCKEHEKDMDDL